MNTDELVSRCQSGDREAFNELFNTYQTQVINIAYTMLSDREDAYDAAQEVFIKVYNNIETFRGKSSFTTWLYRICSNVCNDILRKRQRRGNILSIHAQADDDQKEMEIKDTSPTPEESFEQTEAQSAVREAISLLKPEYREIITYSDIEGLNYDEIAQIIKCPKGTVKSRLNRARTSLKKILSEKRELF